MLEEKIAKIVESFGAKLYDIENAREHDHDIFRVYITSPQGVDLSLCEKISKMLSPMLDVEYKTNNAYFMEVSSPGVERRLKKPSHFEDSIGENIKVKTTENEKIEGRLTGADTEGIELDDKIKIAYEQIKNAATVFKW